MRSIVRLLVLAPLLVTASAIAAPHDRHPHHKLRLTCAPAATPFKSATQPYRKTIAVDRVAEVYSLGGGPPVKQPPPGFPKFAEWKRHIYGCVFGHRGAYLLGVEPYRESTKYMYESSSGDLNVVLAGPIVAYERYFIGEGLGAVKEGVVVQDLRTGRALRDEPTGKATIPDGEPELEFGIGHTTAIVVKTDGAVGWIVQTGASNGTYQVHVADTTGSRVLASGSDIDPTSLALAGSTLYWTQGGTPMSSQLN